MKRTQLASCTIFSLILLSILITTTGLAVPRDFAPTQKGFVPAGQSVLPYAPDRLLIKFTDASMEHIELNVAPQKGSVAPRIETGFASLDALSRQLGVTKISRPFIEPKNQVEAAELGIDRVFMFEVPVGTDIEAAARRYAADPNVEYATPDWRAFPAVVPSDPLYADHWGHNNTAQLPDLDWGGTYSHTLPNTVGTPGFDANAQAAWDGSQGFGSSSVIIAIIDTGVNLSHPDLTLVSGYDFGDNDSNPEDNAAGGGHGTCCAGVAASQANNGIGACGAAPGARVMPLKVANSAGSMYFSAIVNAIYYAADNGANIISMSLGAAISSDPSTNAALQYANNAGVTILAATGNENNSTISYPAINTYVIGVGAASPCGDRKRSSSSSSEVNPGVHTDPNGYTCDGERWWGSNYGSTTKDAAGAVDILGPTILPTTDIQGSGGYTSGNYEPFFNGTSCATPYVAGVCALIKSKNPTWTPAQIRAQLVDTAQDIVNVESGTGWDRYAGYGMVDAAAAVGGGGGGPNPPVAAFVGTPTSGTAPLLVSFTDQSSNSPTSWSWNFGDSGTSSAQNPTHTYDSAGNYTVTLTASNSAGSDVETKTNYITVTAPSGGYATLPYTTGFESGSLDSYWTTNVTSNGRVRVLSSNTPHSGSYHMVMDAITNGTYAQTESWLHVDLAGKSQVDLDFWWKDFGDETHAQDGVYFSNNGGSSFVKVFDLDGGSYPNDSWSSFNLDVDQLAAGAGLGLTSTFVIKFQQYDNYAITTDGFAFDDISVTETVLSPPVADFTASPTAGTAPLDVQFTDASTGATSWSWNFGDQGTSTAQNPSHTYTDPGTYTVTLTANNASGSDVETKVDYITVSAPGSWTVITYDDFESGMGSYTDGGADMSRYTGGTYAWQGSAAADIQDNSGVASSFYHTGSYNVTGYNTLEVEFYFIAISMETNEDFWVQYYNGSSWSTVASFARGTSFNNNTWYVATVTIPRSQYTFPTNAKLRFMCDASGNADDVYIDAITFRGTASVLSAGAVAAVAGAEGPSIDPAGAGLRATALLPNSPNPFNPTTTIAFTLAQATQVELAVFDVSGRKVATLVDGPVGAGLHQVEFDASTLSSGIYFYRMRAGDFVHIKKMTLLK